MIAIHHAHEGDAQAWREIIMEAALEAYGIATTPEEVWSVDELAQRVRDAASKGEAMLVAEREGRVVGVLGLTRATRAASRHVASLGVTVAARARGRGVGTALMRAAEDAARAWGVKKISLGVFAHNDGAIRLYKRLGYVEEGVRRGQFIIGGLPRDEVLMAKWLDACP